jgi:crossover junction endodeoxyribonuclease RuvC
MKIVAIDPGMSGAAAVLEQVHGTVILHAVMDIPVIGEKAKRRLDAPSFAHWLADHAPTIAFVENGRPMPRQGVTSMFRYGRICGALEGIIAARAIPIVLVEPTWKRHLHLDSDKENCRAKAIQLLPSAAGELARMKDHHKAEAILLGLYGLEKGVAA